MPSQKGPPATGRVDIINLIGFNPNQPYNPSLFKYTSPEGVEFIIHERLGLQSVKDLNENIITITANGITHSNGQSVQFVCDTQGRITQITDPLGNPLQYIYSTAGDLVSFRDQENNLTQFSYNSSHQIKLFI